MKQNHKPGLVWCLAFAFSAALGVRAALGGLWPWVDDATAWRLVLAGLTMAYVGFLLALARDRSGRIVLASLAAVTSAVMACGTFGIATVLTLLGLVVWLVRVVCYQRGPLAALLDGGLGGLGLVVAAATYASTLSVAAAVWVAFLTQCLFIYIPAPVAPAKNSAQAPPAGAFDRAHRAAEAALRDLATR